ncbi:MAG TPA: hypothetical protein EYN73_08840 [Chromatiaceae bacterium]|nr:hypothetical protein [Chromatiaceae bacterium]
MAVDYKRRTRRKKQRKPFPGWLMLVTGLAVGLFGAFLYNISHPEMPDEVQTPTTPTTTNTQPKQTDVREVRKPRFDFYTLLPKIEVVIPDQPNRGLLPPDQRAPVVTSSPNDKTRYLLQAGSFRRNEEADSLRAKLTLAGFNPSVRSIRVKGEIWNRVRLGPFDTLADAHDIRDRLRTQGIDAMVLQADN